MFESQIYWKLIILLSFLASYNCQTATTTSPPGTLKNIYLNYNKVPGFDHWVEYANSYEKNTIHLKRKSMKSGKPIHMLEIGIQSGGSMQVWKEYFGDALRYTGLDINK